MRRPLLLASLLTIAIFFAVYYFQEVRLASKMVDVYTMVVINGSNKIVSIQHFRKTRPPDKPMNDAYGTYLALAGRGIWVTITDPETGDILRMDRYPMLRNKSILVFRWRGVRGKRYLLTISVTFRMNTTDQRIIEFRIPERWTTPRLS